MGRRRHTVLGIVGIVAAALVVATLSLTGCGGGSDSINLSSSTPSGFKTQKVHGMSFAIPKDWKVNEASTYNFDADIPGTKCGFLVFDMRGEDIDNLPKLKVYKTDDLDKDVEKFVKSTVVKGTKIKSSAKGKDGSAVIYRFELAGKSEDGSSSHGYRQYTFSGDGYYLMSAMVSEKDFKDEKDDLLAVFNSQKLSDPEAPEKE